MTVVLSVDLHQRFKVVFHDDRVWERVLDNEDDWQGRFYYLDSLQEIASHLAYSIGICNRKLSDLDGWGDLPDDAVTVEPLA